VVGAFLVSCGNTPDKKFQKVPDNPSNPNNPSGLCGNGVLDPGENCDPQASGADRCPTECPDAELECADIVLVGSANDCTARCEVRPVGCIDGDGCCSLGCDANSDSDCTNVCGDGVVDANETCDGDCPTSCDDNNACTVDSFTGSAETCSLVCVNTPRTTCVDNDGCCPAGCTSDNDNDCSDTCGNGVVDQNETCDGDCPTSCDDGNACTQNILTGSAATCSAACSFPSITSCRNNDGCCPVGCNSQNDNDCTACVPVTSCADLGANCGTINNGCSPVNCGSCSGGEICDGNRCVVNTPTTYVGAACASDGQCSSGLTCITQGSGVTGGYCTRQCTQNSQCGAGAHCGQKNQDGTGICLKSCSNTAECGRTSYECFDADRAGLAECWPVGSGSAAIGAACSHIATCSGGQGAFCLLPESGFYQGYCTKDCSLDSDCGTGNHCSLFGVCLKNSCTRTIGYANHDADDDGRLECWPAATGALPVGASCNNLWECSGGSYGICLKESSGLPGGYCSVLCDPGQGSCHSGAVCVNVADGSLCMDSCGPGDPCRSSYTCAEVDFEVGDVCWL